jgi:hypothetical protein
VVKKGSVGSYGAEEYDTWFEWGTTKKSYGMVLYNPGVKDSDFELYIPFDSTKKIIYADELRFYLGETYITSLSWEEIKQDEYKDAGICINSKLKIIEGYINDGGKIKKTKNLYNHHIIGGEFFNIPCAKETNSSIWLMHDYSTPSTPSTPSIKYDYIYL